MYFLDLFAGIGGFRLGLEQAGHICVGFCEIDRFARNSYQAIFDTGGEVEFHDIREISNKSFRKLRGKIDCICGGFPCQAFSLAGRRLGFEDTRGTLFFEIARATQQIQPRFLLLENVKGLLNHDQGRTFRTILTTLNELGYDVEWQVLDSKYFGVPQHRERVYIIGHSRGRSRQFIFPIGRKSKQTNLSSPTCLGNINPSGSGLNGNVYSSSGISPTLTTNKGEGVKIAYPILTPDRLVKRQRGRRMKDPTEPMFTLTAQDRHGVVLEKRMPRKRGLYIRSNTNKGFEIAVEGDSLNFAYPSSNFRRGRVGKQVAQTLVTGNSLGVVTNQLQIRKLTPRECFRLQGFPDWAFNRASSVSSNSQLYKQAGNAVTVPVVYEIGKRLAVIEKEGKADEKHESC
ncbi:DNA (cytosine-5-)-methyltransferase [Streptococcus suis]|nr:DNA (cytosine-5-)-methyltransferase [Streptococcus suis]NQP37571.1 DNA (cytosine-5-)-methyltransferase [Streptococcus suis]